MMLEGKESACGSSLGVGSATETNMERTRLKVITPALRCDEPLVARLVQKERTGSAAVTACLVMVSLAVALRAKRKGICSHEKASDDDKVSM